MVFEESSLINAILRPVLIIEMMLTDRVTNENVKDWFEESAVAVGAGSVLCRTNLAVEAKFEEMIK